MGVKIPKTNNFVIDDVLNIVLKKRKKEEKKKSKKEPKLNTSSAETSEESKNKSDIVESNKAKVKQAFMEVEKIIVGALED